MTGRSAGTKCFVPARPPSACRTPAHVVDGAGAHAYVLEALGTLCAGLSGPLGSVLILALVLFLSIARSNACERARARVAWSTPSGLAPPPQE